MEQAIDIGSGPHCLLARLAVNAGASRVDAIEQNDSFVSHAIGAFGAEAAGETTHAAVTSLRACAGAAALGPLFDITVVDANPPPPSRAAEVQKCAEGAAAAGVEPAPPTDTGEVRCKLSLRMKGIGGGGGGASSSSDGEDVEEGSSGSEEEGDGSGEDGAAGSGEEEEEDEEEDGCCSLHLHHGYSTVCSSLRGGYDLVVHEILGHVRATLCHAHMARRHCSPRDWRAFGEHSQAPLLTVSLSLPLPLSLSLSLSLSLFACLSLCTFRLPRPRVLSVPSLICTSVG